MDGGAGKQVRQTALDRIDEWFQDSADRWRELTDHLPAEHGARTAHGRYAVGYQIVGDFDAPRGAGLLEALRAGCVRYTGWPPFSVPTREDIAPYMYEGNIECWIARDGEEHGPAHSDYWRVSPECKFFLWRGYQEDDSERSEIEPGTLFDLTLPVWRIGEILLHAASMARQIGANDAKVVFVADWNGLAGRRLAAFANPDRTFLETYVSQQDTYRASLEVQASQIEDALPELVDRIVRPMYELFDFFPLPPTLPSEELAKLRNREF